MFPVNPRRGEVALGSTVLRYDLDAIERLAGAYGAEWWQAIAEGLSRQKAGAVRLCLAAARTTAPDIALADLVEGIMNALCLSMRGMTMAELAALPAQEAQPAEDTERKDMLRELRVAAYRHGLDPVSASALTPFEIGEMVRARTEDQWEALVHSSWLTAQLTAIGYHDPKSFPKTAGELLKPKPKEAMNKEQWRAFLSAMGFAPPPDEPDGLASKLG